jgi:hypothetical protein
VKGKILHCVQNDRAVVILSGAENLDEVKGEILHCVQNDDTESPEINCSSSQNRRCAEV